MIVLTERYADKIAGVLSCFDRVVITGTLPEICHAKAMAKFLTEQEVRLFDYTQWAEPLREEIRQHAERLASEAGLAIEFIKRKDFRKADRVRELLGKRGNHPGLVHIFSAMESCTSFKPWYDKATVPNRCQPNGEEGEAAASAEASGALFGSLDGWSFPSLSTERALSRLESAPQRHGCPSPVFLAVC
jgi:hypothetical protein